MRVAIGGVVVALLVVGGVMLVSEPFAKETASSAYGGRVAKDHQRTGAAALIDGHYVVVYKNAAVASAGRATGAREKKLGFQARYVYRHALKGFAAKLNARQVQALRADPAVDFVSKDRRVHATAWEPLAPGEPTPPTGVRRILAGTTTQVRQASGVNVAVIDTGIQLDHPDLNAVAGTDCIDSGTPPDDGNGHGTHVAGTIGAKNNGSGVTGVAPGTKEYAVRVLNNAGNGTSAQVICGIDWVTANAASQNIRVANMSLGGVGQSMGTETCATTTDPERKAICNSTAAGVDYVVAAGNSAYDFDYAPAPDVPAAYPEVLTVTAVADSDGTPGGTGGAPTCRTGELDDYAASFSNFAHTAAGEAHTIAAPGVCIRSTWLGSGYATVSGTSQATPHMAAVVALCINEAGVNGPCASNTPAQTIAYMRADADAYNNANPSYGFTYDPISSPLTGIYFGFLTRVPPSAGLTWTLSVNKSGSGSGTVTSSPTGINCGSTCSAQFNDGQGVTLTAAAAGGSSFSGWTGACAGTGPCVLTMDADKAVSANFTAPPPPPPPPPTQRTLTVTVGGSGTGSVTGPGISCPGDCTEAYADGASVTLNAAGTGGSSFAGWGGACSGTDSCELTMDADKAVSAGFSAFVILPPLTPPSGPAAAPPACNGIPATIVGTEGSEALGGTPGKDVIVGLGGNDTLSGLAGNDLICGGAGKDTLKGGKGNDKLFGQAGKDTLKGGPGKDKLRGGGGKDKQVQ